MPLTPLSHLATSRLAAFIAAVLTGFTLYAQQPAYDLVIRNGRVVDGTGNPSFNADVAIRGDRIAAIGRLADAKAAAKMKAVVSLTPEKNCLEMTAASEPYR